MTGAAKSGRCPSGRSGGPSDPSQQAVSAVPAPAANAEAYSTFVFRHMDEAEARRFCAEIFARFPFMGEGATVTSAVSMGDAMSVADAVRMSLECSALDNMERTEFALEMAEQVNWESCLKFAEKWELRLQDGAFIDARGEVA